MLTHIPEDTEHGKNQRIPVPMEYGTDTLSAHLVSVFERIAMDYILSARITI